MLHTISKFIVWPQYPQFYQILPSFTRPAMWSDKYKAARAARGLPLVTVDTVDTCVELCKPGDPALEQIVKEHGVINLGIPLPIYEQMHAHGASNLFYGGAVGQLVSLAFHDLRAENEMAAWGGWFLCTVVVALFEAFLPHIANNKMRTLSRYHPQKFCIAVVFGGSLFMYNYNPVSMTAKAISTMVVIHLCMTAFFVVFVVIASRNFHGNQGTFCLTFLPQLMPDGLAPLTKHSTAKPTRTQVRYRTADSVDDGRIYTHSVDVQ
eukprot:SAG31_NODE_11251_length_1050_cov_0.784437_1_plen_265_part_00